MTLFLILLVLAMVLILAAAANKVPLWAGVFVLIVALLVKFWGPL
jgi:hypothetical protein